MTWMIRVLLWMAAGRDRIAEVVETTTGMTDNLPIQAIEAHQTMPTVTAALLLLVRATALVLQRKRHALEVVLVLVAGSSSSSSMEEMSMLVAMVLLPSSMEAQECSVLWNCSRYWLQWWLRLIYWAWVRSWRSSWRRVFD